MAYVRSSVMTSPKEDRPAWNAGGRPNGVWSGQQNSSAADTSAAKTSVADTSVKTDASRCFQCEKPLKRDEIGLYRKLVNRGAQVFLCKSCIAAHFKMSEADCDSLIAHFKEAGCSMFF